METFLETVHPEVVWSTTGIFPGLRESYSGHEGVREFWRAFVEPWETLEIEIEEIYELDPEDCPRRTCGFTPAAGRGSRSSCRSSTS